MLEVEPAHCRLREVIRRETDQRIDRVARIVEESQVPAHVHVAVSVFIGRRDHGPVDKRKGCELFEREAGW